MEHESAGLDQRLVDAVERLGDAARAMLRRAAAAEGLSPTQAQLLLRITSDTAPPQGTGALASWLEVSAPTVSDAAHTLARKGLVQRGRTWQATDRGREIAGRLRRWQEPLDTAIGEASEQAKATTLALLLRVIAELNSRGYITTARTCLTCRFFRGEVENGWCALLQTALVPATLRVDCPEHEPKPAPAPH